MNDFRPGELLLAADDPAYLELTRRLLVQQGYKCDTAANASEVERCLRAGEYDLLISDIDMPGNSNLQMVAGLPQLQAGLPVILITGAPSVESAARSVGLAVVAYLIKPVASEVLLAHVRKAVERYRCFKAVVASRQRFLQASADLQRIETSLRVPASGSSDTSLQTFLDLTLQNAAQSLLDLRRLMDALRSRPQPSEGKDWLQDPKPVVLIEALWETIALLEKTKASFKSKDLGQLRKRLETLVGSGGSPPS
jgi:DNA-binding response OmpR family regulator